MKFPKPIFSELKRYYATKPESVHECSRIYRMKTAEADIYTSAMRMCEALVLATRLVRSRSEIPALNEFGGDGKSLLLGPYGYKTNLCPHGLGRSARDVAFFLQDNWGRATAQWLDLNLVPAGEDPNVPTYQEAVMSALSERMGIVGFFNITAYPGQGALALFEKDTFVGETYWHCKTMKFWKLD